MGAAISRWPAHGGADAGRAGRGAVAHHPARPPATRPGPATVSVGPDAIRYRAGDQRPLSAGEQPRWGSLAAGLAGDDARGVLCRGFATRIVGAVGAAAAGG